MALCELNNRNKLYHRHMCLVCVKVFVCVVYLNAANFCRLTTISFYRKHTSMQYLQIVRLQQYCLRLQESGF